MKNQAGYSKIVLNTTEARERLRWCSLSVLALLISTLLACASDPPQIRDAQRGETPAPTETTTAEPDGVSSAQGTPSTRDLSDLLNMVPAEFSDDTLVFSFNDPFGDHWIFTEGTAIHPTIAENINNLNELMGLDFLNYEQGIWSWKPGSKSRTFMAF